MVLAIRPFRRPVATISANVGYTSVGKIRGNGVRCMDNRSRGIRLLGAGALFTLAGLNFWRKGAFDSTFMAVIAGIVLLGGVVCLAMGGYYVSQD